MAIYDISEYKVDEYTQDNQVKPSESPDTSRIFSAIASRLFFLILLLGDVLWLTYTILRISLLLPLTMLTIGKLRPLTSALSKIYLSLKRGLVSLLALLTALFSPALGIMFACTYFIMYDKDGIEEVVPASLQAQFREFSSV